MASRMLPPEQVVPEIGSTGAAFTDGSMVESRNTNAEITSNCARQPGIPVTERVVTDQQVIEQQEHWTLTENKVRMFFFPFFSNSIRYANYRFYRNNNIKGYYFI